jgi:hypothetical protein
MLEIFKRLWASWNRGVRAAARLQSEAIMTVAYVFGVGPVAITFRLMGRTLLDRGPAPDGTTTYWHPRTAGEATMKDASRPF